MNHGKNNPWPEGNVLILRQLWADGLTATQIATKMNAAPLHAGLTRNAVIAKVHRLGLGKRRSPNRQPKRVVRAAVLRQLPPSIKPEPVRHPRAPLRGPSSVRFIERRPDQCPMFCSGEEGASGFVCGEAVEAGSWCVSCVRLVYDPRATAKAAA